MMGSVGKMACWGFASVAVSAVSCATPLQRQPCSLSLRRGGSLPKYCRRGSVGGKVSHSKHFPSKLEDNPKDASVTLYMRKCSNEKSGT
jgi:hypothetical protein